MATLSLRRSVIALSWAAATYACAAPPSTAQEKPVTLRVRIEQGTAEQSAKSPSRATNESEVVVWLRPLERSGAKIQPVAEPPGKRPQVIQKNKSFQPHLTVVHVGSIVDFPNHDPFFHNVFSLFDGKRFDLGLYEAGATNSVRFDHVGVSYLFCNIHPEMSAVVVAVDTPYYGISDSSGNVSIGDVPDGRYELHVWYERSLPDALRNLTRMVRISSGSRELGTIVVPEDPSFTPVHKNKYGQDYPPPPKQGYQQP